MSSLETPATDLGTRVLRMVACALFGVYLAMPTLDLFIRPDSRRAPTVELRSAAPKPEAPKSWTEFFEYPKKYEAHWNDTFGLRDKFLRWHSIFKVLWLDVAPNRNHTIGKNKWIFNRQSSIFETYRGIKPLSPTDLENWRIRIERRAAECKRRGARYLFAICPDKPHIYPEYLPDHVARIGPSRMEQLFDYLKAHSTVEFVDFRPALLDEKKRDDPTTDDFVFYPLGTHWTTRGGVRAVNAIVDALKPHFPNLRNISFDQLKVNPPSHPGDSEARNMYLIDRVTQTEHWWVPANPRQKELSVAYEGHRHRITEVPDPSLPRVLMFHDSFGSYVDRVLAECFARLEMYWSYDFDLKKIDAMRPDVVIEMIVERALVFQDPTQIMPGEHTGPSTAYYEAKRVVYKFDPADPKRGLLPVNRAKFSTAQDPLGPVAILEILGQPDAFALIDAPNGLPNATLLIRAQFDSPRAEHFTILYKRKEDPQWSSDQCLKSTTTAGANELFFELETGGGLEGLIVQPLDLRGTVRMRALEIRVK